MASFDRAFRHIQRGGLNAVAEQEFLAAREFIDRRNEASQEAVRRLLGRAGLELRGLAFGGVRHAGRMAQVGVHRAPFGQFLPICFLRGA